MPGTDQTAAALTGTVNAFVRRLTGSVRALDRLIRADVPMRDEREAVGSGVVAETIGAVVAARRPPRRVTSGSTGERSTVLLRRFLPARLFEWIGRRVMLGSDR